MYLQIAECKFDKICAGHFFFDDDLKEEPKTHYNDIYQRKQAAAPTCLAVQLNCMGGKNTRAHRSSPFYRVHIH